MYSARLSSRPLGWKIINVDNVSRLRLLKADNKEIKEIVQNKRKVVEFKEIEKIRHCAKEKIFFKQLLEYKILEYKKVV